MGALPLVQSDFQHASIEARRNPDAQQDLTGDLLPVDALAAHAQRLWEAARNAKEHLQIEMLDNLRQRNGEYTAAKLQAIREQGGSEVYMMLTNVKCRAAESWLQDTLLNTGERPYKIKATPIPEIPKPIADAIRQQVIIQAQEAVQAGLYPGPAEIRKRIDEIQEQMLKQAKELADKRAESMEDAVDDILKEGGWYEVLVDFISQIVTQHTGFVKGPVIKKVRKLQWMEGPDGHPVPHVEGELTPVYSCPNALDMFPSPNATSTEDGYIFQRITFQRKALHSMIGVPSYNEAAIRAVLNEYRSVGIDLNDVHQSERDRLEGRKFEHSKAESTLEAKEFWGDVPAYMLREWGMTGEDLPDSDPDQEFPVTLTLVGRHVVRALINPDPMHRRPFVSASFESVTGALWGKGVPQLARDLQDICNASARNLVNNMGIASGPQVELDVDRLMPGEDIENFRPWRIWQTSRKNSPGGAMTPGHAMQFHQPDSIADVLMAVYEFYAKLADEYTGIPAYSYGVQPGGTGTATEFSMLMASAARGIKRVIANIDRANVGTIKRTHLHVMLYGDDPSIKMDAEIVATGTASLVAAEQTTMRRIELTGMLNNPADLEIMGPRGRAHLVRKLLASADIEPDDVIPTDDDLRAREAIMAQAQAGPPGMPGAAPGGVQATTLDGRKAGGAEARTV